MDYYEAEITVEELAALVFADLGLPFLKPKGRQEIESETVRFNEIRKRGIMSNLDKKRTIGENLRRNARLGQPGFFGLSNDDLRFKTWERDVKYETNAVVIAMRDVSGSMGEFEKYITRSFYFWMVRFLRTKYNHVRIVFLTHHTDRVRAQSSIAGPNNVRPSRDLVVFCVARDVRADISKHAHLPNCLQSRRRVHAHGFLDQIGDFEIRHFALPDIEINQIRPAFRRRGRDGRRVWKIRLLIVRNR